MWNYPNPLLQIPRDRFQVREHVRKLPMDEDPQATTWRWCHNWLVGCWDENGLSLSHNILTLTLYSVQDHISYISSKQPYHPNNHVHDYYMRSYHNISDCWNTVCWNAIVYYVGYVARPCKSCDTPPFGNCWISAINSLHAVLGPVLVCLKIAGVWTPFQCTNHSTDRGGRGGFVGKVGMSEKDVWASYLNVMKWCQ